MHFMIDDGRRKKRKEIEIAAQEKERQIFTPKQLEGTFGKNVKFKKDDECNQLSRKVFSSN